MSILSGEHCGAHIVRMGLPPLPRMRIAVNTRLLLPDKLEGIGWFTHETMRRIVAAHPEHEFLFLFDRKHDARFIYAPNVTPVVMGPPTRHPLLYRLWFNWLLPRKLKALKADASSAPMASCRFAVRSLRSL